MKEREAKPKSRSQNQNQRQRRRQGLSCCDIKFNSRQFFTFFFLLAAS